MLLLAKDGIYLRTAPRTITKGLLASGNRADVLINCPVGEFTFESPRTENETKLCSLPVLPVGQLDANKTRAKDVFFRDTCQINGTLLHIHSVDWGLPPQSCDLPEFEVNRPCCDCGRHSNPGPNDPKNTSANPVFASRALADLVNLLGQGQEVAKDVTFFMGGFLSPYCNLNKTTGDLANCGIGNTTGGDASQNKRDTLFFDANHVQYTLPVGKVVGINLTFVQMHPFHIHINP